MHALSVPSVVLVVAAWVVSPWAHAFTGPTPPLRAPAAPRRGRAGTSLGNAAASGASAGASAGAGAEAQDAAPPAPAAPATFREGEVLGLRLMQAGRHEEAVASESRPPRSARCARPRRPDA